MQSLGPHPPPLFRRPQVLHLREGPHHARQSVFRRGKQGRTRPRVHTRGYPVCQMQGPPRGAGRRVGVEIPHVGRRGLRPPRHPRQRPRPPSSCRSWGSQRRRRSRWRWSPLPRVWRSREGVEDTKCFWAKKYFLTFPLFCFFAFSGGTREKETLTPPLCLPKGC